MIAAQPAGENPPLQGVQKGCQACRKPPGYGCADVQAGLNAREAMWPHLQMLCEDAPHATFAWTLGALSGDSAQKAQGLQCLGGHT